jgi:hypothetical protein
MIIARILKGEHHDYNKTTMRKTLGLEQEK